MSQLAALLQAKSAAKALLSRQYTFSKDKPLLAILLDLNPDEGERAFLLEVLTGAMDLDIAVVVLADDPLRGLSRKGIVHVPYTQKNRHEVLCAADMALGLQENDIEEMLLHGTVPISLPREEVKDYHPNHETGNGFVYGQKSSWAAFAAIVRACETFKFPYDWRHLVRLGIESLQR